MFDDSGLTEKTTPNVRSFAVSYRNQGAMIHAGVGGEYKWPLCRKHDTPMYAGLWTNDSRAITCKNCLRLKGNHGS